MSIENLKNNWQNSFNESVKNIESCLTPDYPNNKESVNFSILAKWLLETEHDPYNFMPTGLGQYKSNPFQTESVLNTLHHALLDDGEVSFVKMIIEGEVKRVFMLFVWKNEDCFDNLCRKENASMIKSFISGRETQRKIMSGMQEKHPEKTFKIRLPLTESDITFEAHADPIAFIKEVEDLELKHKKILEESIARESSIRKKKF